MLLNGLAEATKGTLKGRGQTVEIGKSHFINLSSVNKENA